jgi:hypothetical protein
VPAIIAEAGDVATAEQVPGATFACLNAHLRGGSTAVVTRSPMNNEEHGPNVHE